MMAMADGGERRHPGGSRQNVARILVIGDTHVGTVRELPGGVLRAIEEADRVVHCGDYVSSAVVTELERLSPGFVGVYGNADPGDVRRRLPPEATFQWEGRTIAVTHPHWAGHPDGLEEELVAMFPGADVILFGHTHEPCNLEMNGTLLLNPGQAYASFMVPASVGVLTITRGKLKGEIMTFDQCGLPPR